MMFIYKYILLDIKRNLRRIDPSVRGSRVHV